MNRGERMRDSVGKIFQEHPQQWGIRGDPYLWDDLEKHFANIYAHLTEEEFNLEFCTAFHELTGATLGADKIYVPKYYHGGMSSGMICSTFWADTALPMLTERLKEINNG